VSHEEVLERIDPSDLGAALNPTFVTWLGRCLEAAPGSLDVVLAAPGLADPPDGLLRASLPVEHARVSRAERYREQLAVYTAVNGEAVVRSRPRPRGPTGGESGAPSPRSRSGEGTRRRRSSGSGVRARLRRRGRV